MIQSVAPSDDRPYTNYSLRTFLLAMKDVMGDKGVTAILRSVGLTKFVDNLPPNNLDPGVNFSDYTRLNVAIEEFYGRAAKGMLQRIGRVTFKYGLKENQAAFMAAKTFLLLKKPAEKLEFILARLARGFTEQANEPTTFQRDTQGDTWMLSIAECAACWQRHDPHCICSVNVGFLEEACAWAVGSSIHVEETNCRGRGDSACEYRITIEAR